MQTLSFSGHEFEVIWKDPEGDIFLTDIGGNIPKGVKVRCGLRQGCCYTPGTHRFEVIVRVLKGQGLFLLHDRAILYQKGSRFVVPAYTAHSFVKVEKDTIFTKEAESLEPR